MISQKESTKPSTALQDLYSSKAKNSLLSIWNLSAICCEKWQTCMQLDELQYNSSQWYWCMLENQEVKTVSNTDSPFVAEMVGWSRKFATLRGYLAGPANPKEIKESKQKDPPNADCCFFNVCTSSNSMSWLLAPSCLAIDLFQWCCAKSCERRPVGAGEVSTQLLSLLGGMNVLLFFGSMHALSSHKFLLLAAHSIPRCAWKPGVAQLAISLYYEGILGTPFQAPPNIASGGWLKGHSFHGLIFAYPQNKSTI